MPLTIDDLYTGIRLWDNETQSWYIVHDAYSFAEVIKSQPDRFTKEKPELVNKTPLRENALYVCSDGRVRLLNAMNDTHIVCSFTHTQQKNFQPMPPQPREEVEHLFTNGRIIEGGKL